MGPPGVDADDDILSDRKLPSLLSLKVGPPVEVKEVKLPIALEQALAFKTERAKQVGVQPEDYVKLGEKPIRFWKPYRVILQRNIAHSWPSPSPKVPSPSLMSATKSDPEPVEFCDTVSLTVALTLLYCHMVAFQMFPCTEICTVEAQCSGTSPFMITHLNTSCDRFRQIGVGPRGW